jgi:hypothetical protein
MHRFALYLAPLAFLLLATAAFARPAPRYAAPVVANVLVPAHTASRFQVWPDGTNTDGVVAVRETVVLAPRRTVQRSRVWACGPVEANMLGGSQRTCEWR